MSVAFLPLGGDIEIERAFFDFIASDFVLVSVFAFSPSCLDSVAATRGAAARPLFPIAP